MHDTHSRRLDDHHKQMQNACEKHSPSRVPHEVRRRYSPQTESTPNLESMNQFFYQRTPQKYNGSLCSGEEDEHRLDQEEALPFDVLLM